MNFLKWVLLSLFSIIFAACTATVSPSDQECDTCSLQGSSAVSSSSKSSSSFALSDTLDLQWASVASGVWTRGVSTIAQSEFKIATSEVTQADYEAVMDTLPPQLVAGDSFPVANVSWYEAALFCNALSKDLGLDTAYIYNTLSTGNVLVNVSVNYTAKAVRLPTEAEWEYAIRAGTTTVYYWGTKTASNYAQYGLTGGYKKIAQKTPNAWSLYDMAGNVSEWCSDWYAAYGTDAKLTNPTGASTGLKRVFRGGSWNSTASGLASSERSSAIPEAAANTRGFRVVLFGGI